MDPTSLADEVIRITRDRGRLTKSEIDQRWPHLAEAYSTLRMRVLWSAPDLESGPRGTGGFRLKRSRSASSALPPMESVHDIAVDLSAEQLVAVGLLSEVMTRSDLDDLVGSKVISSYRALIRSIEQRDPPIDKRTLAAALVLRFGEDLLADAETRKKLSARLKIEHLGRWHPGKAGALHYVRKTGLPEIFAGSPNDRPAEDVEWFTGRVVLPELADFQAEVLDKAAELLEYSRHPRAIISLPTGAGKTRTAVEYIKLLLGGMLRDRPCTVLWVAHTAELLEQSIESLRQVWSNSPNLPVLRVERRFGAHGRGQDADDELLGASRAEHQMVVATPQRLLNDLANWERDQPQHLEDWIARIELVVVDEAHRAAAPQYEALFDRLSRQREPRLLGLTATPFRHEYIRDYPELGTKKLYTLFRHMSLPSRTLGEDPRHTLQQRRVLARPIEHRIDTDQLLGIDPLLDVASPSLDNVEAIDRQLAEVADDTRRRAFVFRHLLPLCREESHRILYFGPTVSDAEVVAVMLRTQGIRAGFVSGATRAPQRRRVVQQFRAGEIRVLCNCEVLTTGFDAPTVTHVVVARPTVSHVLFEQMVGRGLRGPQFGGTETCQVLYFVDRVGLGNVRLGFRGWRKVWGLE